MKIFFDNEVTDESCFEISITKATGLRFTPHASHAEAVVCVPEEVFRNRKKFPWAYLIVISDDDPGPLPNLCEWVQPDAHNRLRVLSAMSRQELERQVFARSYNN